MKAANGEKSIDNAKIGHALPTFIVPAVVRTRLSTSVLHTGAGIRASDENEKGDGFMSSSKADG